jgi:hypothetical protein
MLILTPLKRYLNIKFCNPVNGLGHNKVVKIILPYCILYINCMWTPCYTKSVLVLFYNFYNKKSKLFFCEVLALGEHCLKMSLCKDVMGKYLKKV